jgi:AAA15 family ATPase/GTPase
MKYSKISSVWYENFRGFRKKTTLPLSDLTVLIGSNGSGKTNAIMGLHALSLLAWGKPLSSIYLNKSTRRSDFKNFVTYQGQSRIRLGCSLDTKYKWCNIDIVFFVESKGIIITEESISDNDGHYLYHAVETKRSNNRPSFLQLNFSEESEKTIQITETIDNKKGVFAQLTQASKNGYNIPNEVLDVTREFRNSLKHTQFLYSNLLDWNQDSSVHSKHLKEDGSNLSSVLYELCGKYDRKEDILDFIRESPSDQVMDLEFLTSSKGRVQVQHRIQGTDKEIASSFFSEGQLRNLAIAAILFSVKEGSLVAIDDVDSSLDATRSPKLIKDIARIGKSRNLQILVSSHNQALLDSLPLWAIPDVVFSYQDPGSWTSALLRIEDLETYPELIAQGSIGNLMTKGIIRKYIEDRKSRSERTKESLDWLDRFEKGEENG